MHFLNTLMFHGCIHTSSGFPSQYLLVQCEVWSFHPQNHLEGKLLFKVCLFLIISKLKKKKKVKVAQSRLTLCDPIDCSLPGSSVHGILLARVLEWVAISSSRASCWPRAWTWDSCIAGKFFTIWAIREAKGGCNLKTNLKKGGGFVSLDSLAEVLHSVVGFYISLVWGWESEVTSYDSPRDIVRMIDLNIKY